MWFPWYFLCVLFILPFFDPRRPLRPLHLDLIALVVIGLWPLAAVVRGGAVPTAALVVAVLGLIYLFGRLLWTAFRPRDRSPERLVPVVPVPWLVVVLVVLVAFRV